MTKDSHKLPHPRSLREDGREKWLRRVDALQRIRDALNSGDAEADRYLIDCACACDPHAWTCHYWYKITPVSNNPPSGRIRLWATPEEVGNAIRTGFWQEVQRGEGATHLDGNSAIHIGSLFIKPVSAKARWNDGRILELGKPVIVEPHWRIERHLSVIRFRAEPLVAFVRADGLLALPKTTKGPAHSRRNMRRNCASTRQRKEQSRRRGRGKWRTRTDGILPLLKIGCRRRLVTISGTASHAGDDL